MPGWRHPPFRREPPCSSAPSADTGREVSVDRTRHLAARRRLGRRQRGRRARRARRIRRSRRHPLRHRRCLRRRAQRVSSSGGSSRRHPGHGITVATKMGRRMPQEPGELHARELPRVDRPLPRATSASTRSTSCSCTARRRRCIEDDATYDALDALVAEGAIAAYGVSVETCAQALAAIARPNVTNVQIIFNPFRLKPLDEVLPAARGGGRRDLRARAAGLGAAVAASTRPARPSRADDHRTYNRHGEAFDRGRDVLGRRLRGGPGGRPPARRGPSRRCVAAGGHARLDRLAAGRDAQPSPVRGRSRRRRRMRMPRPCSTAAST